MPCSVVQIRKNYDEGGEKIHEIVIGFQCKIAAKKYADQANVQYFFNVEKELEEIANQFGYTSAWVFDTLELEKEKLAFVVQSLDM